MKSFKPLCRFPQSQFGNKILLTSSQTLVTSSYRNKFNFLNQKKNTTAFRNKQPLKKGFVSPELSVPEHINRPPYAITGEYQNMDLTKPFEIKTPQQIESMRRTCKLGRKVLDFAGSCVKVGVTTDEIDKQVHEFIIQHDAYPSPLGYNQFPKSLCSSINEVMCHGIPDDRPLEDGDIVNLDVSVWKEGLHADLSATFLVGNVDDHARLLVQVTKECLDKAIAICGPNVPLKEIGRVIEEHAQKFGFWVSRHFCGHGVGTIFHNPPLIFHYKNDEPGVMIPGLTFTIEPILCEADSSPELWSDGWTVSTRDLAWAAQFEDTILITEKGHEVLTRNE